MKIQEGFFQGRSKKKQLKDPFDLEGLKKVLKTTSNEMVDIKKQVAETSSKKPYKPFKRNPLTDSKPPNAITSVESEEEEEIASEEHTDEEEVVELQGMWDFILQMKRIKRHLWLVLAVEINLILLNLHLSQRSQAR